MNKITYEKRQETYTCAFVTYGDRNQMVVACEELSECQKEICKILRGEGNLDHLAEEIADAIIMLEQVRMIHNIGDLVCKYMDEKILRLDNRMREEAECSK